MTGHRERPTLRRPRIFIGVERLLFLVAGAGLVLMMLQITLDVATRNLLGRSIPATSLLVANYFMIIVGFIPLAIAEKDRAHIKVELINGLLPRQLDLWLHRLTYAFSFAACVFIIWHTAQEALRRYEAGTVVVELDFPVPVWPAYLAVPVGFAWFAAELVRSAFMNERAQSPDDIGPHYGQ